METLLEDPKAVHAYFMEKIWPLAECYEPSDASVQHVLDAQGIGTVGYSGVGKEYHNRKFVRFARQNGKSVKLGEQLTTRPPRNEAEVANESAYTHMDMRRPEVREHVRRSLLEQKYLQTFVWLSTEFMENPEPGDPGEPTFLYMTGADTFSLDPDTVTLVEYVFDQTREYVELGWLKKSFAMFATTQNRWVDMYYARENGWPSNHFSRMNHAISSTEGIQAVVAEEDSRSITPAQRKWLLLLNDYQDGADGLDPACLQMYHHLYEEPDMTVHGAALEESRIALDFLKDFRNFEIDRDSQAFAASFMPLVEIESIDMINHVNASRVRA